MLNMIALLGRFVDDPEVRISNTRKTFCTFRLAVERDYQRDKNNKEVDYIPCVAWESCAEFIAKHFHKGNMIAVQGSLRSRPYEDKEGKRRTGYDVYVNQAHFTGERIMKQQGGDGVPTIEAAEDYDEIAENF